MGGLGNQMFQYSAGKSLANIIGCDLEFDNSFFNLKSEGQFTPRKNELSTFEIDIKIASERDLKVYTMYETEKVLNFLQNKIPFLFKYHYISETSFNFMSNFHDFTDNAYLNGYWQSEKYFLNIESIIRNDFIFNPDIIKSNLTLSNKIINTEKGID